MVDYCTGADPTQLAAGQRVDALQDGGTACEE
jgi:hypothetical protein